MTEGAWHIITGEYPPAPGGVSDYSAILAAAMAAAGAEIRVWTGIMHGPGALPANGVTVHRVADAWSTTGLRELDSQLNAQPAPRRLLIQYVPNAWGRRGMNREFCRWVRERSRSGDEVRLMIHEPFLPYRLRWGPARWYLAWVQRRMMRTLMAAADIIYLSIPGWLELIRPFAAIHDQPADWLPIFSNIPVVDDPARVRDLRTVIANPHQLVVGSFGTFGGEIGRLTADVFGKLLPDRRDTVGLLLGRGARELAAQVFAGGGVPFSRLFAFEDLPADEISCRLQGCDLMIQPYPDGISSRRSSAMAGLAHGLTVVTNEGFLTDPIFKEAGSVAAIAGCDADKLADLAGALLLDQDARLAQGARARRGYEEEFAVERTVAKLLNESGSTGK